MGEYDAKGSARRRAQASALQSIPSRRRSQRPAKSVALLRSWSTLPGYLRDNEYIITGYRANWSVRDTLRSLFLLHNETGNVWTHLLGFLFFVGLTVWMVTAHPTPRAMDYEPLEDLWESAQDSMHSLGDHIGEGMHVLQDTIQLKVSKVKGTLQPLIQSLNSLSSNLDAQATGLQERMAGMQCQVLERLEVARGSLQDNLASLSDYLHHAFESVEERIHMLQDNLGAVASALQGRFVNIRASVDGSYQGLQHNLHTLQDSLHNLQDNLAGNLVVVKERMRDELGSLRHKISSSYSLFQESLQHLQELLGQGLPGLQKTSTKGLQVWLVDRWPVYVFMAGAMICLLVSSICHLFACCSRHASSWAWQIDYGGIAVLIVTSFYPPVYYGFLCKPVWRMFYLLIVSFLGVSVTCLSLLGSFQTPRFRAARAGLFASLGLFGIFPMCHQWLINGHIPQVGHAMLYEIAMGVIYLVGAAVFVLRVPERFKPGAFDIFFHSHQFFHVLVVLAAYVHFQAVFQLLEWRHATGGCAGGLVTDIE